MSLQSRPKSFTSLPSPEWTLVTSRYSLAVEICLCAQLDSPRQQSQHDRYDGTKSLHCATCRVFSFR
eukprot:scaffold217_cov377-Prasinococcus_capsulatus_cf.AAC.26